MEFCWNNSLLQFHMQWAKNWLLKIKCHGGKNYDSSIFFQAVKSGPEPAVTHPHSSKSSWEHQYNATYAVTSGKQLLFIMPSKYYRVYSKNAKKNHTLKSSFWYKIIMLLQEKKRNKHIITTRGSTHVCVWWSCSYNVAFCALLRMWGFVNGILLVLEIDSQHNTAKVWFIWEEFFLQNLKAYW